MRIAYVRVSTAEQNEERQIEALKKYDIEKWFTEKISGKNMERPKLQEMIEFAREGDTIYIHDWSRLARSTKDLLNIISALEKKGVYLISNKEKFLDTKDPNGKMFLVIMSAINEFERTNMLERQREGIEIAKRKGKYKGRKRKDLDNIKELYEQWYSREKTKSEISKEYNISRPTLDRIFSKYEKDDLFGK